MGSVKLRQQLHEYIDQADDRLLHLVYEIFQADTQKEDWWDDLHPNLQSSINKAIKQLDNREGRQHEEVMGELLKKVSASNLIRQAK